MPSILPTFACDVTQIEHGLKRHIVPDVLGNRRSKALLPPPSLSLSHHPPTMIPVGVLPVENFKAVRFFFSAHTFEARLRYCPLDHLLAVVQPSPLCNLPGAGMEPRGGGMGVVPKEVNSY